MDFFFQLEGQSQENIAWEEYLEAPSVDLKVLWIEPSLPVIHHNEIKITSIQTEVQYFSK